MQVVFKQFLESNSRLLLLESTQLTTVLPLLPPSAVLFLRTFGFQTFQQVLRWHEWRTLTQRKNSIVVIAQAEQFWKGSEQLLSFRINQFIANQALMQLQSLKRGSSSQKQLGAYLQEERQLQQFSRFSLGQIFFLVVGYFKSRLSEIAKSKKTIKLHFEVSEYTQKLEAELILDRLAFTKLYSAFRHFYPQHLPFLNHLFLFYHALYVEAPALGTHNFRVVQKGGGQTASDEIILICGNSGLLINQVMKVSEKVVLLTDGLIQSQRLLVHLNIAQKDVAISRINKCLYPSVYGLIVTNNEYQVLLKTQTRGQNVNEIRRSYGSLLYSASSVVPDGIVMIFGSFEYMYQIIKEWDSDGLFKKLIQNKDLFIEDQRDSRLNSFILNSFKKSCQSGRGAVLLLSAKGLLRLALQPIKELCKLVIVGGLPSQRQNSLESIVRGQIKKISKGELRQQLQEEAIVVAFKSIRELIFNRNGNCMVMLVDSRFNSGKMEGLWRWLSGQGFEQVNSVQAVERASSYFRGGGCKLK